MVTNEKMKMDDARRSDGRHKKKSAASRE